MMGRNPVRLDVAMDPLRDAARKTVHFSSAAIDLTRRKQAEAERAFLATIVESSEDAIFVRTLNGIIISWNAGAERMFGYTAPEVKGRSVSLLVPPDRLDELDRIDEEVRGGERVEHCETVRLRKDGSPVWVSLTNSLIQNAAGERRGISTIARDITKRKQLELEIIDISETLQRRVGQDLHDGLSQQLRGISYLSHALQQTLAGKSLPEARDAARITELLQQAIAETRNLARGLAPLRLEADGLMSALDELATSIRTIYGISCRFACAKPVLLSNRSIAMHLYRIAQEAVHNAIEHGRPHRVVIDLSRTASDVRLTVTDDGRGLPASFIKCGGMGLRIMDYRAKTIGARFDVQPAAQGGTVVSCLVPTARQVSTGGLK